MKKVIGIYTVSGHCCGGGHYTRMKVLQSALIFRGHDVYVETQDPDLSIVCSAHPHQPPDVVIVDVHNNALAQHHIFSLKKLYPTAKTVVFENFYNVHSLEQVNLIVESSFVGPGIHNIVASCFIENSKHSPQAICHNIFLNQGDSDPWGISARLLHALIFMRRREGIHLVTGRNISKFLFKQIGYLEDLGLNYNWYHDLPQTEMAKVMRKCDIAITAPGQTFVELAVVGVPSIIVGHHERHNDIGEELGLYNAAINIGVGYELRDTEFIDSLEKAFSRISSFGVRCTLVSQARRLFYSGGVIEICRKIEELLWV